MFEKIKFIGQYLLFQHNKKRTNGEVFDKIYKKNLWNEKRRKLKKDKFYSGKGSENQYGVPYAKVILKFIQENKIETVVDLGCGDFKVASKFANKCKNYIGIDCVKDLIEYHKKRYNNEKIRFECLDITNDILPSGDLCLIRQVLQHLSNDEIKKVLENSKKYPYIIITEHLLNEVCKNPNMDKTRGMHTRLFFGSGVYLDKEPFNQKIEKIYEIPYDNKSHLEMILIRNK